MRRTRNIRLALTIFMVFALAMFLPCLGIAGSLEPPETAVDALGNPVPTMHAKFACRMAFMDNADGTVTDCKTGMIWMKNANCFGRKNWYDAKSSCSTLATGSCGLYDGSSAGDWHLPTIEELKTLPDWNWPAGPALSNAKGDAPWHDGDAFDGVQSGYYWSSTSFASQSNMAWPLHMVVGYPVDFPFAKASLSVDVWCVRGGQ